MKYSNFFYKNIQYDKTKETDGLFFIPMSILTLAENRELSLKVTDMAYNHCLRSEAIKRITPMA
ncbi:hypothetical protein CRM81_06770 [Yersinia kristensenii]|nr:hypothetical protein ykris0001_5760 [Yersinia kristensenii ATCC 33638]PEH53076.1 hypothetical protein CRM81_06770 [Yersinia kristensenii]